MNHVEAREGRQRVAVYGVALRDGAVLLVQASAATARPGAWWLPGGGLDFGESLEAGLIRELREETGLTVRVDSLLTAISDHVDHPEGPLHSIRLIYQVTPVGGQLVAERDGSTDAVAWHPLEVAAELRSPPFVREVLRSLLPGQVGRGAGRDWREWHQPYEDPNSPLSQRLAAVQRHIRGWLREASGGSNVLSLCAGQGRDLIDVLAERPDVDVVARLVEWDPALADQARERAAAAGLVNVEVITGDAGLSRAYEGMTPAALVLACGVFGNISDADVERTITALTHLSAPGGWVIWTRHRRGDDLTGAIRQWFAERGFRELAFESPGPLSWSVGVHRMEGEPVGGLPDRLFSFE